MAPVRGARAGRRRLVWGVDRLGFYTKLFGAKEIFRVPEEGPAFYLGLRIGDTDLGLVVKTDPGTGAAPRILLSIGVDDVDETLGRVEALGGSVRGGPNDIHGEQDTVLQSST